VYLSSFLGTKRPRREVDHSPPFSTQVKRVKIFYFSYMPCGIGRDIFLFRKKNKKKNPFGIAV
jgi:hypothetical protein